MNKQIHIVVGSILLSALAPLTAVAASDVYIKFDDINGESKLVHCPGGTCTLGSMPAGTYQIQLTDEKGAPVSTGAELSYAVSAPRDAASGLPTGKRQHKPLRIAPVAQRDKASPKLYPMVIADDGSQVVIQAVGHNSTRSNKTSN